MTKFWRADYLGDSTWKLSGQKVSTGDFKTPRALRVWEYGAGDRVRLRTWLSVRRVSDGVFKITGNVGGRIAWKAKGLATSKDGVAWRNVADVAHADLSQLRFTAKELPFLVKLE